MCSVFNYIWQNYHINKKWHVFTAHHVVWLSMSHSSDNKMMLIIIIIIIIITDLYSAFRSEDTEALILIRNVIRSY